MRVLALISLFCFLCISSVQAQQNYVWEEYGISFTLADDFVEEHNDINEFSAAGDGMFLSIIPFKDASIDDSDITVYTVQIAASLGLEEIDDVDVLELNYFQGGYVEGYKDGAKIFLLGMIDPDSDTNYFVVITFQDEDEEAIKEAINIVTSIQKL